MNLVDDWLGGCLGLMGSWLLSLIGGWIVGYESWVDICACYVCIILQHCIRQLEELEQNLFVTCMYKHLKTAADNNFQNNNNNNTN